MERTAKQIERQNYRTNGKYSSTVKCQLCGKSAGLNYCSDERTDTTDSAGNEWGDIAINLCLKCAQKLAKMEDNEAYQLMESKR